MLRYLQSVGDNTPVVVAVCLSPVLDLIQQYRAIKKRSKTGEGIVRVEAQAYKTFVDKTMQKLVRRHLKNEKRTDFDFKE